MNERVVEFPKTKPLGSLWILIFIFNFLLSLPDFTLTIKNRQTDQLGLAVVGPVLKLKKGVRNQAVQQSRPEAWLAAAAALVIVGCRFRRFMAGMVTKWAWFVNEMNEQRVNILRWFIKIQDGVGIVHGKMHTGGKDDQKD